MTDDAKVVIPYEPALPRSNSSLILITYLHKTAIFSEISIKHNCELSKISIEWCFVTKKKVYGPLALGHSKKHGDVCSRFRRVLNDCTCCHQPAIANAEVSFLHYIYLRFSVVSNVISQWPPHASVNSFFAIYQFCAVSRLMETHLVSHSQRHAERTVPSITCIF